MGLRIFASNWQNHNFCRHMKKSTFYIFLRDPDFANPYSSLQIHTDPYKSILVSGILPLICRRSDASKRIGFWGTDVLYGSDPLATEGYPKFNGALSRTLSCSQPLLGMWPRPIQGRTYTVQFTVLKKLRKIPSRF